MADGLNLLYQWLQMYEGLSDDKLLYDYDRNLALGIALVVSKMTNLHYQPSLAEAIDYAKFLSQQEDISKDTALSALSILLKDNPDYDRGRSLLLKHGWKIWSKGSDDEDDSGND